MKRTDDYVVAAGPIMGEFGWQVFDVAPKVAWFFGQYGASFERVVVAPRSTWPLFPTADTYVDFPWYLPRPWPNVGRSTSERWWKVRRKSPFKIHMEALIQWSRDVVGAGTWLEIPYRIGKGNPRFLPWRHPSEHSPPLVPEWMREAWAGVGEYVCVSPRARNHAPVKNWAPEKWDQLVTRLKKQYRRVFVVGQEEDTYCPKDAERVQRQDLQADLHLSWQMACLSQARMWVGGNTGVTHLALLCGCPVLAWGRDKWNLPFRMRVSGNWWNTPITFLSNAGWDPEVEEVMAAEMPVRKVPAPWDGGRKLYEGEGDRLQQDVLVREAKGKRAYLEIGSREGCSLEKVMRGAGASLERVVCCDKWEWDKKVRGPGRGSGDHVLSRIKDAGLCWEVVRIAQGDSKVTVPLLNEGFDLILVDGDHGYEGCLADLRNAWQLLNPGGCMIIDDVANEKGVRRAIREWWPGCAEVAQQEREEMGRKVAVVRRTSW